MLPRDPPHRKRGVILSDDFVYIHQPKTAGTFVTSVLTRIHRQRARSTLGGRLFGRISRRHFRNTRKHAGCDAIPESHAGKPILASIRNPYDRYVSQYEFGWWWKHPSPHVDYDAIRQRYPHFPELSFAEYLSVAIETFHELTNSEFEADDRLGWHTEHFVRLFFHDPAKVFPSIDKEYLESVQANRISRYGGGG